VTVAVRCADCGKPTTTRPRCPSCAATHQPAHAWGGRRWLAIRTEQLRCQPRCFCGAPATEVDHIIQRSDGGADDFTNLQSLCHRCHNRKTKAAQGALYGERWREGQG
jgi:5-methylcytosine-specific restriction protein A